MCAICKRKLAKRCDLFGHKKMCRYPLLNGNCVFTCNCKCCLIKAGAFVLRILCVGVVGVC